MKKTILLISWLFLSVGLVLSSLAGYYYVTHSTQKVAVVEQPSVAISAASEPNFPPSTGEVNGVTTIFEYEDSRATLVANFLERHNSPLQPYPEWGHKLVEIADRYNLDFRLLPAIAMQESNLCKAIPEGTYNCLGFGIHSRGTLGFTGYEPGFERAARELKANYIDIGLTTPEEIMTKYTPSSNGSWAESVNQWMAEMRYDDRQLGRELKENTSVLEFTEAEATQETQETSETSGAT